MKKLLVIHPVLFAIYPILFLFANNLGQYSIRIVFTPIIAVVSFLLLSWYLLNLSLKDKNKSGLIVSLFLVLFFSYGNCYVMMHRIAFVKHHIGSNMIIMPAFGLLFLTSTLFFIKSRINLNNFTKVINIIAIALIAFPIFNIGAYELNQKAPVLKNNEISTEKIKNNIGVLNKTMTYPNIYFIILDAYPRSDILKKFFNYQNDELLNYLSAKGFYIAKESRSNYMQTSLSLSSTLNLNHFHEFLDQVDINATSCVSLKSLIENNRVVNFLRQRGYLFVNFHSGYSNTQMKNADIYMSPNSLIDNLFQEMLVNFTPINHLRRKLGMGRINGTAEAVSYALDHLGDSFEVEAPLFVFAHIICPHLAPLKVNPRKVNKKKNNQSKESPGKKKMAIKKPNPKYIESFRKRVMFVDKKVKIFVNKILSNSSRPSIIILQGDHGPSSMLNYNNEKRSNLVERFSILNACYLPNKDYSGFYDTMTSVNTFRIIFNQYFGTNYDLLKDESYFSPYIRPYALINVTEQLNLEMGKAIYLN